MDKTYNHNQFEQEIYKEWNQTGSFEAKPTKNKKPFTVIMPPPNANNPMHVGHAMFVAIEDLMIRFHRMLGDVALWLPGTDHAGIETQFVFEKNLSKEGKSRFDFDRETLFKMIWDYVQENSGVAVEQMKRLGASADWSRFKFTLDPDVVNFVTDTFIKLHQDDLVYRGERLINYCVRCGTGYSELEVEHEERIDSLYYVRYPLVDQDEYVVVATTRPEPIWADTHLAVNPSDKKNKHLIGKKVRNPLTDTEMAIIGDEFVDPEFGTGIVKLTPAHDFADFEVALKHKLSIVNAIDSQGRMVGGPFKEVKVAEARKKTVEELEKKELMEKINEKYLHRVGTCYRCKSVLEPLPLPQFFIKTQPMAKKALAALDNNETVVMGAGREKILSHWLENIRDWNISRQIVWGIRMPVWYNSKENPDIVVAFLNQKGEKVKGVLGELLETHSIDEIRSGLQTMVAPKIADYVVSKESPGEDYVQETDTFDTWFSSGQWPVVTLKTNKPGDFEYFYPTSVMETGYDILPIWVMRMMLLGEYLTDQSPFSTVYLHGLIRDEKGRKMSKSIGNVINPLDMVDKYGADALRMALVISSTPGQDKNVGESTIRGMRNFSNKIWNAARFVLESPTLSDKPGNGDEEFIEKLNKTVSDVTNHLNNLRLGLAAETVYSEFWHWFCDVIIEKAKTGEVSSQVARIGLVTFLKLLHPFVPFVTEAVWQEGLRAEVKEFDSPTLIEASWPN